MKKCIALAVVVSTSTFAGTWNEDNNPRKFDEGYQYHLSALPLKSALPANKTPWSSSFWPRKKGSIVYRWNSPNPTGFDLVFPSHDKVRSMNVADLAKLSPAEKFDLAQGHYDYPLATKVAKNADKDAKNFEGICDGWTASAIQFAEPAPVEIKNPDGIVVPFGTSDVKALMSYDTSINQPKGALGTVFMGSYCSAPLGMFLGLESCKDINPGAFHVVLANQLGLKKEAVAVDIDPGHETWNQPVYGYEFEITGETHVDGAARAYVVHAKMMYAEDDPTANGVPGKVFTWTPTVGTADFCKNEMELDYVLEVDYAGRITGGSWLGNSKKHHPDLLWLPKNHIVWTPEFEFLNQIYKPAAQ